jgi:hypothetical protein
MSPKEAEGVVGCNCSSDVNESHSAGDSACIGLKLALWGVGCASDGGTMDGLGFDRRFDGGEKEEPFSSSEGD